MPSSEDIIGRSFFGDFAMESSTQAKIEIRRAHSMADYLFLRSLRNRVKQSMTNHTGLISYVQQLRFYLRKPAGVDVYIAWVGSTRAGYLLLRHHAPTTLITEAVDESCRRTGVAIRMVRYAQQRYSDLTAEILADNTASIKLHEAAGFELVGAANGIKTFRFIRPEENSLA